MSTENPIPWTTQEIIEATRGDLLCGDPDRSFSRVSIDSREISSEDFFFAIIGERLDGHEFAATVVDQGVRGLVIGRQQAGQLPVATWEAKNVRASQLPTPPGLWETWQHLTAGAQRPQWRLLRGQTGKRPPAN